MSAAGLFLTLLLTNSRLPYVLARDGLLPARLAAIHPRFGTPWVAVVISAVLYAAFAAFSFKELIVLNVWLYSLSLLVELAAFAWLRARRAGDGAAVAGAGGDRDRAGGGRGAGRALAAGHGDGGLAQHPGGCDGRPDRAGGVDGGAGVSSRLSSMTWARQSSVGSE